MDWSPLGGTYYILFWQLLQPSWCRTFYFSPFWITSARLRGGFLMPGQPSIPILVTQVYAPWRGHFCSINMGGNSYNLIDLRNGCHGLPLMVGEVFAPHQSATAHVNAGNWRVLIQHCLPAPMGAWSSDQINKQSLLYQTKDNLLGMSGPSALASGHLWQISDSRKTAVINSEWKRFDIVIAVLQETRLAADRHATWFDYTFFWQDKLYSIGLEVKENLPPMIVNRNASSPFASKHQSKREHLNSNMKLTTRSQRLVLPTALHYHQQVYSSKSKDWSWVGFEFWSR